QRCLTACKSRAVCDAAKVELARPETTPHAGLFPGWRLFAAGGQSPDLTTLISMAAAAQDCRSDGRRVLVIDDPLAEGVDPQRDQRLIADHPENMRPIGRQHHRDAG